MTTLPLRKVTLLSLDPWDEIWRRNQHLASRLVSQGHAESIDFVTPPTGGLELAARRHSPLAGINVITPPLVIPRRWGGHRAIGTWQRRQLKDTDLVWINDPVAGAEVVSAGLPLVYDVTDDWRSMPQPKADRHRVEAAEDLLAKEATTVVCSQTLADRWRQRYGVNPTVVPNGVDVDAIRAATPMPVTSPGPHAVYVGTLHENRIDAGLLLVLAKQWPGTIHLVGPNGLSTNLTQRLRALRVDLVGPVTSPDVPRWLNAADVLICPHLVNDFTLSLDAIKSHEYLATDRPVVATPSSGFQDMSAQGLWTVPASQFAKVAIEAWISGRHQREAATDWSVRAEDFAHALNSPERGKRPRRSGGVRRSPDVP